MRLITEIFLLACGVCNLQEVKEHLADRNVWGFREEVEREASKKGKRKIKGLER